MAALNGAIGALRALVGVVPGFEEFDYGPNRDYEIKSGDYDVGFICTFATRHALNAYAAHPAHLAAGTALVAQCTNGASGIMVVDLEI